jgi:predicted ATPase/DNA-binding CsgD family transcriptional regulator
VTDTSFPDLSQTPPARSAPIPHREPFGAPLPTPMTSFVGREREVTAVAALLRDPGVRLVTLTGPGGVGKTRLALAVATMLADGFPDGVVFVPLASIRDPGLVLPTIARVLGIREGGDRSVFDRLKEALAGRRLLLVLDNLEQVNAAAPLIAAALDECRGLSVLATSRSALSISGEREFPVPPLSLGRGDSEAVQLFVERARAARPGFALTEANALPVGEVCRRLDGLPLAIELAAARSKMLSPAALLSRLDHGLPTLSAGPADQPARQRTMREAIAWSYELLRPEERVLFRRLAVFAGGFSLEAAEAVSEDDSTATGDLLEGVAGLVNQSLLRRLDGGEGDVEPRFGMLETVREFALERLAASGEEEAIRRRHAAWCQELVERGHPTGFAGMPGEDWLDKIEAEIDNVRAALAWLNRAGDAIGLLRLAWWLRWFWWIRSHRTEGRSWVERGLAAAGDDAPPDLRGLALRQLATHVGSGGDLDGAVRLLQEGLAITRATGDAPQIALTLLAIGASERGRGRYDAAIAPLEEATAMLRRLPEPRWAAAPLNDLGITVFWTGDTERAVTLLEEAADLYGQLGDPWGTAVSLSDLALVLADRGELERSAALFVASRAQWLGLGTKEVLADWLARVAVLASVRGLTERAMRLFGAASALRDRIGYAPPPTELARYDRAMDAARQRMGSSTAESARTVGTELSEEEACAEALAMLSPTEPATPSQQRSSVALTPREREVLRLVAEGRTDREIAAALGISHRTVMIHVRSLLAKLEVGSRTAAAAHAHRRGLL